MPRGGKRDNPGGRPPLPAEERAKPFHLKAPPGLLERIAERANTEGITKTALIVKAIRQYLDTESPRP